MSFNYKPIYEDTDIVYFPARAKTHLNACYGKMLCEVQIDKDNDYWNYWYYPQFEIPQFEKENNMRKEFIVLHDDTCDDGSIMIVRKSAIIAVSKEKIVDDIYCFVRTENCKFRVTESYSEVVKRLFE